MLFAADSTARLWVNGQILAAGCPGSTNRRCGPRWSRSVGTCAVGPTLVVVLHHGWGDIVAFQRSASEHAGLSLDSTWLRTDAGWRSRTAEEFGSTEQFRRAHDHAARIRYPIDWDARQGPTGSTGGLRRRAVVHRAGRYRTDLGPTTSSAWRPRAAETDRPRVAWWRPEQPGTGVGRRETDRPSVLAQARLGPDHALTEAAGALVDGRTVVLTGRAGDNHYLALDFHRPVHGYPFVALELEASTVKVRIGYGELVTSAYAGSPTSPRAAGSTSTGWSRPGTPTGSWSVQATVATSCRTNERRAGSRCRDVPRRRQHGPAPARDGEVAVPDRTVRSFSCATSRSTRSSSSASFHAGSACPTPRRHPGARDGRRSRTRAAHWSPSGQSPTPVATADDPDLADGQDADGGLARSTPATPGPTRAVDSSVPSVGMLYDDYRSNPDIAFVAEHFATLVRFSAAALSHLDPAGCRAPRRFSATQDVPATLGRRIESPVAPWIIDRLRGAPARGHGRRP